MLWGSDRYEFLDDGCDFLISGFSPKGKPHVYLVKGKLGEIINLLRFQDFGCIGITSLANSILSDLITSELQTESVLKILELIAKTYCDYSKLRFDEMFDSEGNYSKSYSYHTSVGGKWIFMSLISKLRKVNMLNFVQMVK